jgi:protein gp37
MFDVITATWNPVKGCKHDCKYCWARRYASRLGSNGVKKYADGFKPALCEKELSKKFKDKFVFAVDMGDLFGKWVPSEWIIKVLTAIENNPESQYLFLTKDPKRYFDFFDLFPKNVVLGTTIETNRQYHVSKAPPPIDRARAMTLFPWDKKLISIEPIMDFDLDVLVHWIKEIRPTIVYVGYDNYNNKLPEPSLAKTQRFIQKLEGFTRVKTKTLRDPEVKQIE